eukprot:3493021-Rhodomonas_salina.4
MSGTTPVVLQLSATAPLCAVRCRQTPIPPFPVHFVTLTEAFVFDFALCICLRADYAVSGTEVAYQEGARRLASIFGRCTPLTRLYLGSPPPPPHPSNPYLLCDVRY